MRVSIQYSVELGEIPLEIENLITTTVVERLHAVVAALTDLSCERQPEEALTTISEARQALFSADERLSDLDSILRGYIVQQAALLQEQSQQPEQASSEEIPVMSENGEAVMMPASQDTMKMVQATLAAHRAETQALQRTMNLGFGEEDDSEGKNDAD